MSTEQDRSNEIMRITDDKVSADMKMRQVGEPRFAYQLSWDERDALTYIVNMSRDIC